MILKVSDIIGFAAVLGAGYMIGDNSDHYVWIAVLLALGFYFAVVLS